MAPARTVVCLAALGTALLAASCRRQQPDTAADLPGGGRISAHDFKVRYGAYLSATSSRDNILLRKKILSNMINESLIFDDLHRTGLDADSEARARAEQAEEEALLMGYARHMTLDTMSVRDDELKEEFRRFRSKVKARYLYAGSEEDAWKLREELGRGATFDSLARGVFRDPGLATNGGDLGYFGWGEMEPALEDAAYSLPVGDVSAPVKLRIGYAIVKVDDRVEEPLASVYDYANQKEKLAQAVRRRKVLNLLKNATEEIGREISPTFNERAARALFAWIGGESSGTAARLPAEGTPPPDTIGSLEFMTAGGTVWSAREFLGKLARTTEKERRRIRSVEDLETVARGLATRDVLLARARAGGMERDSDVVNQVRRVRDEYFLKRWASAVQDTVGLSGWKEGELRSYFQEHRENYALPPEVNVAEVLVRTEGEARDVMRRLRAGAGFAELARARSIRLWAAAKGGELGFGTKASFGILGDRFFGAAAGQLVGPERVDPYWGVFKVLAKREGRAMSFEESRDEVIKAVAFLRKQEVFKEAVDRLRGEASVGIHEDVLANVEIK